MTNLTERALAEAVTELLETKPLDKITIREITDRCGMTRNTFYYHFQDVYDLLRWILEQKAEEILEEYEAPERWEDGFISGLTYLYEHKKMINHIYRSVTRENLEVYIRQITNVYAMRFVKLKLGERKVNEKAIMIVADFFKNAFAGAVLQWLDADMNYDPKSLAVLCNHMFIGTIDSALRSAEEALSDPEFTI